VSQNNHTGTTTITDGELVLGLIIGRDFSVKNTSFLTPGDSPQQLAVMAYSENDEISPHIHNLIPRTVQHTQEVLIIVEGKLRVDFYGLSKSYIKSHIVSTGDVLLLCQGGHGFFFMEDTRMIEVKNGPYLGEIDSTKFPPIISSEINLD
jgi:hypothetical protein